jgi:hypothetical protein
LSIPALLLSFAVWMVWSVVVAKLPQVGFAYTTDQLFWLAALPGLSGATLRIFYSFMVPVFGGRLWTTLTTWSLMIPAIGIGFAVQDPQTPYWIMLGWLAVRLWRRQFCVVDVEYRLLLSQKGEGQRARTECRARQSRRQRDAIRCADCCRHRGVFGVSAARPQVSRQVKNSSCRTPDSSGSRSSRSAPLRPGSA